MVWSCHGCGHLHGTPSSRWRLPVDFYGYLIFGMTGLTHISCPACAARKSTLPGRFPSGGRATVVEPLRFEVLVRAVILMPTLWIVTTSRADENFASMQGVMATCHPLGTADISFRRETSHAQLCFRLARKTRQCLEKHVQILSALVRSVLARRA